MLTPHFITKHLTKILFLLLICLAIIGFKINKRKFKNLNNKIIALDNTKANKSDLPTPSRAPLAYLRTLSNTDDYIYFESYNNRITDHLMFDLITPEDDFNNLSDKELINLEKICTNKVELDQDKIYVSKAFNCLGKIYTHQYNFKDKIYKAISNISKGLGVYYLPDHPKILAQSIIKGFEKQLPTKFQDLSKYFTGFKDDEIPILNELIQLNIPQITARAHYRLYMIHLLGRASIKEKANPDLKLAVEELNQAVKYSNIKADNIMDIAFTIDDKYAGHTGVVMASALLNSDLSTFYKFNIIMASTSPLTADSRQKLQSLKNIRDYEVNFVDFPKEIENLDEFKFCADSCTWPQVALYRMFLDKIFPELDKILYLDSDLVVLSDLTNFKQINMDNYFIGGVIETGLSITGRLGDSANNTFKEYYINTGVTYFNLSKMRKENGLAKIAQAVKDNQKNCAYDMGDQDMMNLAFEDSIYYLSSRWNDVQLCRVLPLVPPEHVSFIKHYSGMKPWRNAYNRDHYKFFSEEIQHEYRDYWRYREITPWKDLPAFD